MDTTSNPLKTMNIKAPLWFYFVATLSLLWNIMGLMAFVMQMTMTPDALAQMSPDQIKLYETTPIWVDAVFGFAVVSGVLGCLLLLFRKLIAYQSVGRLAYRYFVANDLCILHSASGCDARS
ncbi:hypothetical protein L5M29_12795 [Shewanella sp. SM95]|nr:hypothetical protein [Shewanella sp. SM95]